MKSDEEIMAEIEEAAAGLLFMSEADYPLEPLRMEGAGEPDPGRLRELAGRAADAPVEVRSLEEFFRPATSEQPWKAGAELASARRFQNLARTLRENLADVRVYRIGEVNMPVYIIGKSSSGSWLGLSTRVVET
jgi:Nuclease A inhibitor-like protein